ncbi:hypothetical protein [Pseudobacteriovorax antillogorgiicola]|nr:hypothetical protein [Pseudobacteriovorax antillogorgiicola]
MKIKWIDVTLLTVSMGAALFAAYMRIQCTLVGYQIGDLKDQESRLMDERSSLKMTLAKLTSKQNLTILASKDPMHHDPFEVLAAIESQEPNSRN